MIEYYAHGVSLALAWFLAIDVVLSLAVALVAPRTVAPRADATRTPGLFLSLRLLPPSLAALFVAVFFMPSYVWFEPRELTEAFGVTVMTAASAAVLLIATAGASALGGWWRAQRRVRAWEQSAEAFVIPGVDIPTFRVDARQPILALAGVFRSRLIVTTGLIDALTPEEFAACLAHEVGHHRGWDNVKRLAMRGAPDLLRWTSIGRRLEESWVAAAELRADAAATTTSRADRLSLASALVKVARLTPLALPQGEPICTLVGGGDITARVRRLVDDRPAAAATPAPTIPRPALMLALLVLAMGYAPLVSTVHHASEVLVHFLP